MKVRKPHYPTTVRSQDHPVLMAEVFALFILHQ